MGAYAESPGRTAPLNSHGPKMCKIVLPSGAMGVGATVDGSNGPPEPTAKNASARRAIPVMASKKLAAPNVVGSPATSGGPKGASAREWLGQPGQGCGPTHKVRGGAAALPSIARAIIERLVRPYGACAASHSTRALSARRSKTWSPR